MANRTRMMKSTTLLFITIMIFLMSCAQDKKERIEREDGYTEIYTLDKKSDRRNGPYKIMDEYGNLIEDGSYSDGKLHGERHIYHRDGETVMTMETYADGQFEGPFKTYYRSGALELEGQYIDGAMKGKWQGYYPNGQLKEIVTFDSNLLQGPFIEYYDDGALKAEGTYLDGENEHGELLLYDSLGVLERKMDCDRGRCATTWLRDEN